MGKLIHSELCKKLKLQLTNKFYMLTLKFILENVISLTLRVINEPPNLG